MAKGKPTITLDLANRLALGVKELAQALGVCERLARELVPEIPHFYLGNRPMFSIEVVKRWMQDQGTIEGNKANSMAKEILGELQKG